MVNKVTHFIGDHLVLVSSSALVLLIAGIFSLSPILGLYPFGPESTEVVTVNRLYVDVSGSKDSTKSSYMVATDKGVFEMNNSLWLWVFNIDEIYGQLEAGKKYEVTVKGNKLVNLLFQVYPHILTVKELN